MAMRSAKPGRSTRPHAPALRRRRAVQFSGSSCSRFFVGTLRFLRFRRTRAKSRILAAPGLFLPKTASRAGVMSVCVCFAVSSSSRQAQARAARAASLPFFAAARAQAGLGSMARAAASLPKGVMRPSLSRMPSAESVRRADSIAAAGGGVTKDRSPGAAPQSARSMARGVRSASRISGLAKGAMPFSDSLLHRRTQSPGQRRPARPCR